MRFPPILAEITVTSHQNRLLIPQNYQNAVQNRRIYGYGATLSANFSYGRIFAASPRLDKTPNQPLSG
jgi:hypothetical protein